MSDRFFVNCGFGDPVIGDVRLATYNGNLYYGYYGFTRKNNKGEIKTPHRGFDYYVEEGTSVYAVGDGFIDRVRFGRPSDKKNCAFRDKIQSNSFESCFCFGDNNNKQCNHLSGCYGVQVWLKLDDTRLYAYYAHLSELSKEILSKIPVGYKGNTVKINLKVTKGFIIGKSGRTGIASDKIYPPHLHFECRKGIETGTQISPNNIVCTQFKIKRNEELFFDESDERLELPYYSNKEMHSYFLFSLDTNKGNFEGLDMNYYYLLKKWKQLNDETKLSDTCGHKCNFRIEKLERIVSQGDVQEYVFSENI